MALSLVSGATAGETLTKEYLNYAFNIEDGKCTKVSEEDFMRIIEGIKNGKIGKLRDPKITPEGHKIVMLGAKMESKEIFPIPFASTMEGCKYLQVILKD